ncbi:hypothetical protein RIF29_03340 [Crotalaria pallida]|uniref:Uncharacterized protein n=1 Tax=Crotalaria pallida TaxID=3830 RepID=A0AAN9J0P9_CROPI
MSCATAKVGDSTKDNGANVDIDKIGAAVGGLTGAADAKSVSSGAKINVADQINDVESSVPETILDSNQEDDWTLVRTRRKAQQKEVLKGEVSKPLLKNG